MIRKLLFNLPADCEKCRFVFSHPYYSRWRDHTEYFNKGFNKGHRHFVKASTCPHCQRALRDYKASDLESFTNDLGTHYRAKINAKKIGENTVAPFNSNQWYWHVHHEILAEKLTEPIENRIAYIKASKKDAPETRLHFLRPVQNLPVIVEQQDEKVARAKKIYESISSAYGRGNADYTTLTKADKAFLSAQSARSQAIKDALEAQHKIECFHYCPWDGKTLLPYVARGKR